MDLQNKTILDADVNSQKLNNSYSSFVDAILKQAAVELSSSVDCNTSGTLSKISSSTPEESIQKREAENEENGINGDTYEIDNYYLSYGIKRNDEYRQNVMGQEPDRDLKEMKLALELGWGKNPSKKCWKHVRMPVGFSYTCAIIMNDPRQGLLHSFLRHWDQWRQQSSDFEEIMNKLAPIQGELDIIQDAPNHRPAEDAIRELYLVIEQFESNDIKEILTTFEKAQKLMLQIIEKNLEAFVEEGVDFKKQILAYFGARSTDDKREEMALGVSKQLFFEVEEFQDNRPVRFITTVFFIIFDQQQLVGQNIDLVAITKCGISRKEYKTPTKIEDNFGSKRAQANVKKPTSTELGEFDKLALGSGNPNDHFRKFKNIISYPGLLHVKMPTNFGHTCAIFSNNIFEGLLHTIARHSDQWLYFIPKFDTLMNKHSLIKHYLEPIRLANNKEEEKEACKQYAALRYQPTLEIRSMEAILMKLQIEVYNCIQTWVTDGEYLGEKLNENYKVQIFFSVLDIEQNSALMAICVSDEYYPPLEEFLDNRHFRTIITVFFKDRGNVETNLIKTWP